MGRHVQWKKDCFHIFSSLPKHWFYCLHYFCAKSPCRGLFNRNQFSFVLFDMMVWWVSYTNRHRIRIQQELFFSYPGSFLAVGSREPRETTWALHEREIIMEGNKRTRERLAGAGHAWQRRHILYLSLWKLSVSQCSSTRINTMASMLNSINEAQGLKILIDQIQGLKTIALPELLMVFFSIFFYFNWIEHHYTIQ